ncbi:Methyltransferase-like protein 20 [Myotis davidii]|uniref:Electron transfer flavoprotein beta subunit lysine methyltransferase n=1 Tax=Myotis davidii TaxID=225400 RepID=L5LMB3_MYODS|nr:Methyltransferase-like protein 20 [Myotis davidii]
MKAFLEENTEVTSSGSLTPEIRLRLLTPRCKFWWERADLWPHSDPYWAIYWPGGQALSRYLLDNPDVVRGKSVLDLGSGCGATAIAAKMSGASRILANDIDPKRKGEGERDRNINDEKESLIGCLLHAPGDQARNPGMCPWQESNPGPSIRRLTLYPLSQAG